MKNWVTQLTIKQLTGSILGLILVFPVFANLTHFQDRIVSLKTTYSELQYASNIPNYKADQLEQITLNTSKKNKNLEQELSDLKQFIAIQLVKQQNQNSEFRIQNSVADNTNLESTIKNSELSNTPSPASSSKFSDYTKVSSDRQDSSPKVLGVSTSSDFITSFRQAIVDGLPSDILTLFKGGNGGSGSSGTTYVTGPTQYSIGQTLPTATNLGTIGGVTHLGTQEISTNQLTVTQSFTVNQNVPAEFAGNLSVGGNLSLTGNQTTTGDLTVNGNTTLGNETTDTLTLNSQLASNIVPNITNTYDLGSSGLTFKDLYLGGTITSGLINGQTISSSANFTGSLSMNGAFINTSSTNSYFTGNVGIGTTTPGTSLDVIGTIRGSNGLTISSGTVSLPAGQIDNTELANSSLTITAGNGLTNGGAVSLGSTTTLNIGAGTCITSNADDIAITADCISDTQLQYNTGQHLTSSSTPTFAGLTLNGNLSLGANTLTTSNTTVVTNLNSDLLDGQHGSYYAPLANISGTDHYITKFNGTNALENSVMFDNGTNVGVGTTTPDITGGGSSFGRVLSIASTTNRSVLELANLQDNMADGSILGQINFIAGSATSYRAATIQGIQIGTSAGIGGLAFRTSAVAGTTVEAMRIDSTGNVGIGTTDPTEKLSVVQGTGTTGAGNIKVGFRSYMGETYSQQGLVLGNAVKADNTANEQMLEAVTDTSYPTAIYLRNGVMQFHTRNSGTIAGNVFSSERMRITSDGNVGIGSTSPQYKFDLNGTGRIGAADGYVKIYASGNQPYIVAYRDDFPQYVPLNVHFSALSLRQGGTTGKGIEIDSNGYVGIGTASMASFIANANNLVIAETGGGVGITLKSDTNQTGSIYFADGIGDAGNYAGVIQYSHVGNDFEIYTNSAEVVRILSNGNVGIGTSTPSEKLHVVGGILSTNLAGSGNRCVYVTATGVMSAKAEDCGSASGADNMGNHIASQNIQLGNYWLSGDGGNEGVFVKSDGNVGIGTSTPGQKLHSVAQIPLRLERSGENYFDFNISSGATTDAIALNFQAGTLETAGFQFRTYNGSGLVNAMTIGNTGSVGIGTTTPAGVLHTVASGVSNNLYMDDYADSGSPTLIMRRARGTSAAPTAIDTGRGLGAIDFYGWDGSAWGRAAYIVASSEGAFDVSTHSSLLKFYTTSGTTLTQQMTLTSSGNLGIGIASPNAKLEVSTGNDVDGLRMSLSSDATYKNSFVNHWDGASAASSWMALKVASSSGTQTEAMRILGDGNVGIGAPVPNSTLHIKKSTGATLSVGTSNTNILNQEILGTISFTGDDTEVGLNTSHAEIRAIFEGTASTANEKSTAIAFYTGAANIDSFSERLRITADGYVGIGTTTPSEKVDVGGGNIRLGHASFGAELAIGLKYSSFSDTAAIHFGGSYDNYLSFYTADTGVGGERMRITKAGYVGIGTTVPVAKLNVANDITWDATTAVPGQIIASGANTQQRLVLGYDTTSNFGFIQASYPGQNYEYLVLNAGGGNVGIGTTNPSGAKLEVAGNININPSSGKLIWGGAADQYIGYTAAIDGPMISGYGSSALGYRGNVAVYVQGSSGNVGIGTTNPATKLSIGGAAGLVAAVTGDPLVVNVAPSTDSRHAVMVIEGFGNGSVNPRAGILVLRGGRGTVGNYNVAASAGDPLGIVSFEGISNTTAVSRFASYIQSNVDSVQATTLSGNLQFHVINSSGTDVTALHIKSDGNVGIGTTIPGAKLGITTAAGGDALLLNSVNNTAGTYQYIKFQYQQNDTSYRAAIGQSPDITNTVGGRLSFFTDDSAGTLQNRMTINRDGNVGIGTSTPGKALDVVGGVVRAQGKMIIGSATTATNWLTINNTSGAEDTYGDGLRITRFTGGDDYNAWITMNAAYGGPRIIVKGGAAAHGSFSIQSYNGTSLLDRMTIASDGNVGIGTTTPATKFSLYAGTSGNPANSGTAATGAFRINGASNGVFEMGEVTGANGSYWMQVHDKSDQSYNYHLALNPNGGNVGIGWTSPDQKLMVNSSTSSSIIKLSASNSYGNGYLTMYSDGATNNNDYFGLGLNTTTPTIAITYPNRNVGIGTTTPGATLHVLNSSTATPSLIVGHTNSSGDTIQAWHYDGGSNYNLELTEKIDSGIVRWTFKQKNNGTTYSDVLTLDRGNVGIGTTNPGFKLDVQSGSFSLGGVNTLGGTYYYGGAMGEANQINNHRAIAMGTYNIASGDGAIAMGRGMTVSGTRSVGIGLYDSASTGQATVSTANVMSIMGGNVGIGTTNPAFKLDVLGTTQTSVYMYWSYASTYSPYYMIPSGGSMYIGSSSGNIATINGSTGAYTAISDFNKKRDIELAAEGLSVVELLQPKKYSMKTEADGTPKHIGFIAQDVKDVLPDAYTEETAGGKTFIGLNYNAFIPVLVNAIKELNNKITILEVANGQLVNETAQTGITLNNVKAIVSISGLFSVDELGNLKVSHIEIGTAEKPSGITIYDFTTKQPYCVIMNNGAMENHAGKCEDVIPALINLLSKPTQPSESPQTPNSNVQIPNSTNDQTTPTQGDSSQPAASNNNPDSTVVPDSTPAPVVEPAPEVIPEPTPVVEPVPEVTP